MALDEKQLKKIEEAAEEVRVGYTRRYGKGYPEAHVLADAIPDLLVELRELRERK